MIQTQHQFMTNQLTFKTKVFQTYSILQVTIFFQFGNCLNNLFPTPTFCSLAILKTWNLRSYRIQNEMIDQILLSPCILCQ